MKKIKLTEKDLKRIVKRVLNEGLFSRKKKIKSFQDYNDYVNGIDTSISIHYFSLRATLPIQKQFNFILKIGAAIGANFNEAAPFTGAGLSYQINKHWSTQLTCQGIGAPFILFAGPVTLGFNYQF